MKTYLSIIFAAFSFSGCADMQSAAAQIHADNQLRDSLPSKPGATIGMTANEVMYFTNWGRPNRVNRTVSSAGVSEQWVYSRGYLYFENDILKTIQN